MKVSLSIKYPERENVSSPPSTAKITNAWSHPSSIFLHGVVSRHMQNLNFQLDEKKIWRKLQSHERKICVLKYCNGQQIKTQKICAACGTLKTDKKCIPISSRNTMRTDFRYEHIKC